MFGDSVTVADTLLISGFSILIVFLVLLLLSFMIDFCAWLLRRREMKGEDGQRAETVKTGNGNAAAGMPSSQEPAPGRRLETKAMRCLSLRRLRHIWRWTRTKLWCEELPEWKTVTARGPKMLDRNPYDKEQEKELKPWE